jgi:hypothetical protein
MVAYNGRGLQEQHRRQLPTFTESRLQYILIMAGARVKGAVAAVLN